MLSSSPERRWRCRHAALAAGAVATGAAIGTPAGAAEVYYQPIVQLASSYNTNVDLDPTQKRGAVGYFADAATNIGIATRQSETTLQPRLLYNYYPTVDRRDRLEGFLNLSTRYSWQRDRFNMTGFFDHRDDVNAEQPGAETNPVNPGVGETPTGTGQLRRGVVRNYLILDPTFVHLLTPLSSIGIAGEYQRMDFSPSDTSGHVDFDYYKARVFYAKTLDLRSDVAIGAFGSRYEARSIDSHTNAGGVQFNAGYNWSQVLRSDLTLQWQRTQFEETSPRSVAETSSPWAATLSTVYKQQASSYRVILGRTIYPNSAGGLYRTDQIRGQYDRDFTQRLHLMGAVLFFRDETISGIGGANTRNYGTATVRVQYMMTQRLFVAGNYSHIYQKYRSAANSADANLIGIAFGYRGLERQR